MRNDHPKTLHQLYLEQTMRKAAHFPREQAQGIMEKDAVSNCVVCIVPNN